MYYTPLAITIQRGGEPGNALSLPNEPCYYAAHLNSGVFLSMAGGCLGFVVIIAFRTLINVNYQTSARQLLLSGIGFLVLAAGLGAGAALETSPGCNDPKMAHNFLRGHSSRWLRWNMVTWGLQVAMSGFFGIIGLLALGTFVDMQFSVTRNIAGRQRFRNRLAQRLQEETQRPESLGRTTIGMEANITQEQNHQAHVHPQSQHVSLPSPYTGVALGQQSENHVHPERLRMALSAYDTVIRIATHCTCADLKNLISTSKGMRNTILGTSSAKLLWQHSTCGQQHLQHDQEQLEEEDDTAPPPTTLTTNQFKGTMDSRNTYGECVGCAIPVCRTCSTIPRAPLEKATARHLLNCRPCCSTCFEKKFCRHRPPYHFARAPYDIGLSFSAPRCFCWQCTIPQIPSPLNMIGSREEYTSCSPHPPSPFHIQTILVPPPTTCRSCAGKSDEELVSILGGAGKSVSWPRINNEMPVPRWRSRHIAEVVRIKGLHCFQCQRNLRGESGRDGGSERVWWVCENCWGECRSSLHYVPA